MTRKQYIHRSEFQDIVKGKIVINGEAHQCRLNSSGQPSGFIKGTTEDNLQQNVGGWNCRHQLVPVSEQAVQDAVKELLTGIKHEKLGRQEMKKATSELADNSYRFKPSKAQDAQARQIERRMGLKRGQPMDISSADSGNANPKGHKDSCQTSAVALVARFEGYNVTARPYTNDKSSIPFMIGEDITKAFRNSDGTPIKPIEPNPIKGMSRQSFEKMMNGKTSKKGIYIIGMNRGQNAGHDVVAIRPEKGGRLVICEADTPKAEFTSLGEIHEKWESVEILRVDDKLFNIELLPGIVSK